MRTTLSTGTPAELATPTSRDATRGLVLWPDIFGLRPLFDAHCQRLADDHGWAVCAIEPFPGQEHLDIEQRHERAAQLSDDDKRADAVAAADLLGVDTVGLLGFCMGGMYVMKSLPTGRFDRGVAFYGMVRVPEAWSGGAQGDAIDDVARRGDAELLAIFGGGDPWCPEDDIAELEALGGGGITVVTYPDAGHGWAQDPDRDGYRATEAADAWARAEAFLAGS